MAAAPKSVYSKKAKPDRELRKEIQQRSKVIRVIRDTLLVSSMPFLI